MTETFASTRTAARPRRPSAVMLVLAASLLLGGCDTVRGWFGGDGDDEPKLPGDRISVLQLEQRLTADPDVAALAPSLPAPETNEAWTQSGGSGSRVLGHVALGSDLRRVWSANAGAGSNKTRRIIAQPVVANGLVVTLDADGEVRAFDLATGRSRWSRAMKPDSDNRGIEALGGGIAYGDGRLYVAAGFRRIEALDVNSGATVWAQSLPSQVRAAPAAAADRVYVLTVQNQLLALAAANGEIQWASTGIAEDARLLGSGSPAVAGSLVVAAQSSGELVAVRTENGRQVWSDNLSTVRRAGSVWNVSDIRAPPVIDRDLVFAINLAGRMVAIDQRSGARIWQQELGALDMPWVAGDTLYLITTRNELVALSRDTGQARWVTQLAEWENPGRRRDPIRWTGPVLAGGRLIVAGTNEDVLEISPADGSILKTWDAGDSVQISPVVAGETLLLLDDDGTLSAYR
jgi:outer membrane protein assembly factor BamB